MTWTTIPYSTLDRVKTALNIVTGNDDAYLNDLMTEAQDALDREIGYAFQQDVGTSRVFTGNGKRTLLIEDCLAVTQVMEKSTSIAVSPFGIQVIENTQQDITADCLLGPDNQLPGYYLTRITDLPFSVGKQNYQVTGTWGQSRIPSDITRAHIRLVVHWYKIRDANYANSTANTAFGKVKYVPEMPMDVVEVIDRYKHTTFASGIVSQGYL